MANQRSKGQKMVGFWADKEFVAKIDEARGSTGVSQFLRNAVAAYLRGRGIIVSMKEASAPDRQGKGGPRLRYPPAGLSRHVLNEKAAE